MDIMRSPAESTALPEIFTLLGINIVFTVLFALGLWIRIRSLQCPPSQVPDFDVKVPWHCMASDEGDFHAGSKAEKAIQDALGQHFEEV